MTLAPAILRAVRANVISAPSLELYSMDLEHLVESEKLGRRVHA
jgi:hypothetical protein